MPEHYATKDDHTELKQQLKEIEKWQRKLHKFSIDTWQASLDQRTRFAKSGALKNESAFLKKAEILRKFQENVRAEGSLHPAFLVSEAAFRGGESILSSWLVDLAVLGLAPELAVASRVYKGSRAVGRIAKVVTKLAIKESVVTPVWKKLENYLRNPGPDPKYLEAIEASFKQLNLLEYQSKFLQATAVPVQLVPPAPALPSKVPAPSSMEHIRLMASLMVMQSRMASLVASSPQLDAEALSAAPSTTPTLEIGMPILTVPLPQLVNQPQSYAETYYDERGRVVGHSNGARFQLNPTSTLDFSLETSEGGQHAQVTHGFCSEKLGGKPMSLSYGATVHEGGITHTGSASIQPSADTTLRAGAAFGGGASFLSVGFSSSNPVVIGVAAATVVAGGVGYGIYKLVQKTSVKPPSGIEAIGRFNVKQTKALTKAIHVYEKAPSDQNKAALAQQIKTCQGLPLKNGQEILDAMDYALKQGDRVALKNSQIAVERYHSALNQTIDAINTANQAENFTAARQLSQQAIKDFPQHQLSFKQFDASLQAQQEYATQREYMAACEAGNYQAASQLACQSPTLTAHLNTVDVSLGFALNLLKEKGVDAANQWMQDAFQGKDQDGSARTQYAEAQYAQGFTEAAKQTAEATLAAKPDWSVPHQEKCHLLILDAALRQPQTAQTKVDILTQTQSLAALSKVQSLTEQGKKFLLYGKDILWNQQKISKTSDPALATMTEALLSNPELSSMEKASCYGQLASDPALSKAKSFEHYQAGLALDPTNPEVVNGTAAGHGERLHFPSAFSVCKEAKQQLMQRIVQCQENGDTESAQRYKGDLKNIRKQENKLAASQLQIGQFGLTLLSQALQNGCDSWKATEIKKGVKVGAALAGAYLSSRLQKVTPRPPAHMQLLGSLASAFSTLSLAADVAENWHDEAGKRGCKDFALTMNVMSMGLGMTTSGVGLATHMAAAETWSTGTIASSTLGVLTPAAALVNMFYLTPQREAGNAPMHFDGIMLEGACHALTSTPVAILSFGLASEAAITSLLTGSMHALGYGATAGTTTSITTASSGSVATAGGATATWSSAVATFVGSHAVAFAVGGAVVIVVIAAGVYYNHQWYANRIHNIKVKLNAGGLLNRLEAERLLSEILNADKKHEDALAYSKAIKTFVAELNKNYQLNHATREKQIDAMEGVLKKDSDLSRFFSALTTTLYPHAPEIIAQYSERHVAQMRSSIIPSRIYGPQYLDWQKILQTYVEQGNNLKAIPPKIRDTKASTEKALEEDTVFIAAEKKADNLAPGQMQALETQSETIQTGLKVIYTQVVDHEKKLTETGLMACCDQVPHLMEANSDLPALLLRRHQESMRELRGDAAIEIGGAAAMCMIDQLASIRRQPDKSIPPWPIEVIHPPLFKPTANPFHQENPPVFASDQVFFKQNKPTQPPGVFYAKAVI